MDFQRELLALMPQLRAYARGLVHRAADADDLVQDVVMRAWAAQERFEPGTNMRAWLFTILRNRFYNAYIARPERNVALDDAPAWGLATPPTQEWALHHDDLVAAVMSLDAGLREALILSIGAEMSYREIGQIMGCPVGTVKSRVFRARRELAARLARGRLARPEQARPQPVRPEPARPEPAPSGQARSRRAWPPAAQAGCREAVRALALPPLRVRGETDA